MMMWPDSFHPRVPIWCFCINLAKVGEIISRFEKKGFYLKGLKLITVDRSFAERHYADLSAKPFFNGLVEYIISGRKIIGATNPSDSAPGTIRGDFAVEIGSSFGSPEFLTSHLLPVVVSLPLQCSFVYQKLQVLFKIPRFVSFSCKIWSWACMSNFFLFLNGLLVMTIAMEALLNENISGNCLLDISPQRLCMCIFLLIF